MKTFLQKFITGSMVLIALSFFNLQVNAQSWTAGTGVLYANPTSTKVGIGLTAPNAALQFSNTTANRRIVLWESQNDDHQFYGFGINSGVFRYQVSSTAADHIFYAGANSTTSNELVRIKGTGLVGIGTSTPHAPLQFSNASGNRKIVLFETADNDHQFYGFGLNTSTLRYQVDNTAADHVFYAAASTTVSNELMRVKGTGLVGIGTSSPSAMLHVKNATNAKLVLESNMTLGSGHSTVTFNSAGTDQFEIDCYNFPACPSPRMKIGPVSSGRKAIYFQSVSSPTNDNKIIFSNNETFGRGACVMGNPSNGISGTYLFDDQIGAASLLLCAPVVGTSYTTLPSGYIFSAQGNGHISGNLGVSTTTIPSGYEFALQGDGYVSGNLGVGTSTIASGYVAGVLGNATLNGRIQVNNTTNTAPNNTTAGLNISNTTTGTIPYSWVQTESAKPLALNPIPSSTSYVAIGFTPGTYTIPSTYKLAVDGKILCTELKVKSSGGGPWPDYVFDKDYKLISLDSVAQYISENKHLPEVPSAKEVQENGINTGEMQGLMLKKIEELTLYMIDQKKEIEKLKEENKELKQQLNKLSE